MQHVVALVAAGKKRGGGRARKPDATRAGPSAPYTHGCPRNTCRGRARGNVSAHRNGPVAAPEVAAHDGAALDDVEHLPGLAFADDVGALGEVNHRGHAARTRTRTHTHGKGRHKRRATWHSCSSHEGAAVRWQTGGNKPHGQPAAKRAAAGRQAAATYAATLASCSSVRDSRMPRRSVVLSLLCCACDALATMPRKVTRSRAHSLAGVELSTVAARGELYSKASWGAAHTHAHHMPTPSGTHNSEPTSQHVHRRTHCLALAPPRQAATAAVAGAAAGAAPNTPTHPPCITS
jgi:hypothetical protein